MLSENAKELVSEKISRTSKGFHPIFYVVKTDKHKISIV